MGAISNKPTAAVNLIFSVNFLIAGSEELHFRAVSTPALLSACAESAFIGGEIANVRRQFVLSC